MLFDQNWNQVFLNTTTPVWFCDVDGVLNAHHIVKEWKGSSSLAQATEDEVENENNWLIHKKDIDPTLHFSIDQEKTLHTPRFRQPEIVNEIEVSIAFSSELIEGIRQLIESQQIQLVWLTGWLSHASKFLNKTFDFPADIPFLEWNFTSDLGEFQKCNSLLNSVEKFGIQKFIWTDDEATKDLTTFPTTSERGNNFWLRAMDSLPLVMRPDPIRGINKEEFNQILNFLEVSS